jgi:hypothetical protein
MIDVLPSRGCPPEVIGAQVMGLSRERQFAGEFEEEWCRADPDGAYADHHQ